MLDLDRIEMHSLQSDAVLAGVLEVRNRRGQGAVVVVKVVLVAVGSREAHWDLQHFPGLSWELFFDVVDVGLTPRVDVVLDYFASGYPVQVGVVSVYQNHDQPGFKAEFGVQDLHFRQAMVGCVDEKNGLLRVTKGLVADLVRVGRQLVAHGFVAHLRAHLP